MKLSELQAHFSFLYGRRNSVFLRSRQDRINLLGLAIGDLQEAIRKGHSSEILGIALARIVSRIFCQAENFRSFLIDRYLAQKYPSGFCSWCQKSPCQCPEKRPQAKISQIDPQQIAWSLSDWCLHLDQIYGQRNKEKEIENILNRLFKEIAELQSLECVIGQRNMTLKEIEDNFGFELADALAWTIAVANFLGIDLEKAVWSRYKDCWNCHKIPCVCTIFNFNPVKWEELEPVPV